MFTDSSHPFGMAFVLDFPFSVHRNPDPFAAFFREGDEQLDAVYPRVRVQHVSHLALENLHSLFHNLIG